jgi:hypothetical protein
MFTNQLAKESTFCRFAEIEGIVALAMLIERYEIKVDEEKFPVIPGESILVSFSSHVQRLSLRTD